MLKRPAPPTVGAGGCAAASSGDAEDTAPAGAAPDAAGATAEEAAGATPEDVSVAGVTTYGVRGLGLRVTGAGEVAVVAGAAGAGAVSVIKGAVAVAMVAVESCAEVTLVVVAAAAPGRPSAPTPPVLSSTAAMAVGAAMTGAITTVVAGAGAGELVVWTYAGSAGSRRARSRSRHDATIIVQSAAVAAAPAMTVQSVLLRAKRA